jgi:uncharacterized protein YcfL
VKNYVFEPIHVLNVFLVSACSAKVAGPGYASVAPVAAPALPASSPTAPEPTLTASDTDFIAAMLAP